jgi:hypothetical protein
MYIAGLLLIVWKPAAYRLAAFSEGLVRGTALYTVCRCCA